MTIYNPISRFTVASLLCFVAMLTSCDDRLPYDAPDVPTEGETEVTFELGFKDFTPQLHSRANGQSIQTIDGNQVWLVIFHAGGEKDGMPYTGPDGTVPFPLPLPCSDATHGDDSDYRVTAKYAMPSGQYRMYVIANVLGNDIDPNKINTERGLLSYTVAWNNKNKDEVGGNGISPNSQMFGVITTDENQSAKGKVMYADPDNDAALTETKGDKYPYDIDYQLAPVVTLGNKSTDKLHAWLLRCASKITIAFDGIGLNDDVTISIMSATVKDIPAICALGIDNKVTAKDNYFSDGETLYYYGNISDDWTGTEFLEGVFASGLRVSKSGIIDSDGNSVTKDSFHSDNAKSLFFFENMQGKGKDKAQAYEKPGDKDLLYVDKDDKPFGTYIEVEALYKSKESHGMIIYRFMLGQDISTDYNATRNTHYKLTLCFRGKGNEIDWHIDYGKPVLRATNPAIFDYQGQVFVPDPAVPNLDHNFTADNTVLVSCYTEDAYMNKNDRPWEVEYSQDGNNWSKDDPGWLELLQNEDIKMGPLPYQRYVTFRVDQSKIVKNTFKMKDRLNSSEVGSKDNPINLADTKRNKVETFPASITSTANCYVINGPGWYMLPLIYGNAIKDGNNNKDAYTGTGTANPAAGKSGILAKFLNHNGGEITTPYIEDYCSPSHGFLVWQDVQDLIDYSMWSDTDIKYKANAYKHNGKNVGGLIFHVTKAEEGNAVIAVSDNSAYNKYIYAEIDGNQDRKLPSAFWSWHIWVTNTDAFQYVDSKGNKPYPADKTIKVSATSETNLTEKLVYDLMPMNLGWCSNDEDITYYPERTCYIRFSSGSGVTPQVIPVVQKSHIALPMGNNPYYQWGRKDPFIGADQKDESLLDEKDDDNNPKYYKYALNKFMYFSKGEGGRQTSPFSSTPFGIIWDDHRLTTVENFGGRIKDPYRWQLPPRLPKTDIPFDYEHYKDNTDWRSDDETYYNLWDSKYDGNLGGNYPVKTIYDPCPVGFQVPSLNVFSGFTTRGQDSSLPEEWFNVKKENIKHHNGTKFVGIADQDGGNDVNVKAYTTSLYEFYTNREKYQSIVFPVSGYRDWDAHAEIYRLGTIGYCWTATNQKSNPNMSFNLEYNHYVDNNEASFIRPRNPFYPCDGFPIRPVVQENVTIK